jgi:hypothetical protein
MNALSNPGTKRVYHTCSFRWFAGRWFVRLRATRYGETAFARDIREGWLGRINRQSAITIDNPQSIRSAFSIQHSTISIQHSAFSIQHSAFSIQQFF